MSSKVHFMGIGGSGINAAAVLAKNKGFEVSGCDLEETTDYLNRVKSEGIKVYKGHSKDHISEDDLLVVSPAILYLNPDHPECKKARKDDKLLTWHKFVGDEILKNKKVIGVTGTHGKSTTTAMIGRLLERARLDPSVLVGAKVKEWEGNLRIGKSEYFVIEADDFYEKFLDYKPDIVILNNIEFDHPDYFENVESMLESYGKLLKIIPKKGLLIYNKDSTLVDKLVSQFDELKCKRLSYSLGKNADYQIKVDKIGKDQNRFSVINVSDNKKRSFTTPMSGMHSIFNLTGAIILGYELEIEPKTISKFVKGFKGIGRRLELLGEKGGVKLYDDYAHHPTAVKKTLKGLRDRYKDEKILAVVEPHMYSRTKHLLEDYEDAFEDVDEVVITKIYRSRDKEDFGVSEESILKVSNHKNIQVIKGFKKVVNYIKKNKNEYDVIVVMGAGDSYKLARMILDNI